MSLVHRRLWPRLLLAVAAVVLYFTGLTAVGLLGPDEPRYAAIAREMARSGDWVTPRLWGEAWFEKPPLLYWMTAPAFRLGLGDDLAPRLPVALTGLAFLAFYYRLLCREFGRQAAWSAALILGTSAGWLGFSRVGVTDLPMSAAFSAAMLLGLPWLARGERRGLTPAAFLLGLAVLGKGLVPLVLAIPLLALGWRRWRDWLKPAPAAAFLLAAAPWYLAMTARYGMVFLDEFFLKHHFVRVVSDELQHVQPVWFFLPVLAAGLYPWTPLAALLGDRRLYADRRVQFLLAWLLFGLVFFSASRNKLPGYLLPVLPAACALLGLPLARARRARWALGACGLLLALIPLVAEALPSALLAGIRRAEWGQTDWRWFALAALPALAAWRWGDRRREWAFAVLIAAVTAGVLFLQWKTFPVLEERVSVRSFWRRVAPMAAEACIEQVDRERRYGLNYYAVDALPDCGAAARPLRILESPSGRLTVSGPEQDLTGDATAAVVRSRGEERSASRGGLAGMQSYP